MHGLESRLADEPLAVIGIHSPAFDHERDRGSVATKVRRFRLRHPVMLDNDLAYWRGLGYRFWPAFYLVDKQGRIRFQHAGETHSDDAQARRIEEQRRRLLDEPG